MSYWVPAYPDSCCNDAIESVDPPTRVPVSPGSSVGQLRREAAGTRIAASPVMTARYKPVYEAIRARLAAETEHRRGRSVEAWILAERECVMREVNHQRGLRAYAPITIAVVERAERMAVGHIDYVSKYAHAAADLVFRKEPT